MAYNQKLADRLREHLVDVPNVEEKEMFRGVTFMVDGKMCISVSNNELMCRIDPEITETVLERAGCRAMVMKGKMLKGYVYVAEEGYRAENDFNYWITLTLAFNPRAKASAKKKKPVKN